MSNLPGWDYLCDIMEKSAYSRDKLRGPSRREYIADTNKENEYRIGEFPARLLNNPPQKPSGMLGNINAGIEKLKYDTPDWRSMQRGVDESVD